MNQPTDVKVFTPYEPPTDEFYKQYVTSDHGHRTITWLPEAAAIAMVNASAYSDYLLDVFGWYGCPDKLEMHRPCRSFCSCSPSPERQAMRQPPVAHVMNKGAIRITPSFELVSSFPELTFDQYLGDPVPLDFKELWVYVHDGVYYLTTPTT